jgi:hypothetical protein
MTEQIAFCQIKFHFVGLPDGMYKSFRQGPPTGIMDVFLFLFFTCKCNLVRNFAYLVRQNTIYLLIYFLTFRGACT